MYNPFQHYSFAAFAQQYQYILLRPLSSLFQQSQVLQWHLSGPSLFRECSTVTTMSPWPRSSRIFWFLFVLLLRPYHEEVKDGKNDSHHDNKTNIPSSSNTTSAARTTHSVSEICQFQVLLWWNLRSVFSFLYEKVHHICWLTADCDSLKSILKFCIATILYCCSNLFHEVHKIRILWIVFNAMAKSLWPCTDVSSMPWVILQV